MPTGYTADVKDGKITHFEDFALLCARAMGACIMQRDDPMHDLPKPEPMSDHYPKALAKAEADLKKYSNMSIEEATAEAHKKYLSDVEYYERQKEENRQVHHRYTDMLYYVRKWNPPTKDHTGFKEFMIEQLNESIKWDIHEPTNPTLMSGAEYRKAQIEKCAHDVSYYKVQLEEELKRYEGRKEWIEALYKSLNREMPT